MRASWILPALVVALLTAGCGTSEHEKQAEAAAAQAQAATEQAQTATEEATKQAQAGMAQVAKGLEAMAGNAGAAVDPVGFKDLQVFFPELDGWSRKKPTGEQITSPMPFAQAEVRYEQGDASLDMKIMDSGFHQLLIAPYMMFLSTGYQKETESGYEKSTTVNGEPGWEKWDGDSRHGELNAIVGKRYLVLLSGEQLADMKPLQTAMAGVDFPRLAALK